MIVFSQDDLKKCHSKEGRRPIIERQDGNTEYVVRSQHLKISRDSSHNISVIAYGAFSSHGRDVLFSSASFFI